jgi:hypothetical protein
MQATTEQGEHDVIEKPERVGRLGARAPRALPLGEEVGDVRLHLVRGELIRRPVVVASEAPHLPDVFFTSWVRGENPRTVMSRIIRARNSLMGDLRRQIGTEAIVSGVSKRRQARATRRKNNDPHSSERVRTKRSEFEPTASAV